MIRKGYFLIVSFILLPSCSGPTPIIHDNSKEFEKAESFYNVVSKRQYNYIDYHELTSIEKGDISLYSNISGQAYELLEKYIDTTIETPLNTDESKKYCISNIDGFYINGNVNNCTYASLNFTKEFENLLSNSSFVRDYTDDLSYLFTLNSLSRTYNIYKDGSVGTEYENGLLISNNKLPLFLIFIECLNAYSLNTYFNMKDIFMGNEVSDITLQLGNSIIKKDNLKEYIQKDEIHYSSYLFNSVCFDYSKMIKLSYSYNNIINVLYIDKNNTFIRDINIIRTTGPLYLTLDLSQTYSYQVIMSSLIDVTSLFSLFE